MSANIEHSDKELLERISEGEESAFRILYDRYWKLLYTTAYNIIRNQNVAQDAVQEVFIDLWQRRQHTNIQALKAYLTQAIRFQVLKAIKAQKMDEEFCKRLAAVTADIYYDNPLLFKEQEALVEEIMNAIPGDCRHVFQLSREEHLTYKQIASRLSISEKTVEKK